MQEITQPACSDLLWLLRERAERRPPLRGVGICSCACCTRCNFLHLRSLRAPANAHGSLPCGGPNTLLILFNHQKYHVSHCVATSAPRGQGQFAGLGREGRGLFVVLRIRSSEHPPWKYPLVPRAVKMLSRPGIIITGERSNFGEPTQQHADTASLTLLLWSIFPGAYLCSHLARLPAHFHNNNTLHFGAPFHRRAQSAFQTLINEAPTAPL